MKKGIYAVLALLAVCALVMGVASCGDDTADTKTKTKSDLTVTFDVNGGPDAVPKAVTVKKGGTLGDKLPTLAGNATYVFEGWWTDKTAGDQVKADTVINKSQTLYAHWDILNPETQWQIIFNLNDAPGTAPTRINVDKGTAVGSRWPADPVWNEDWDFTGWFENKAAAAGDTKYTKDTVINNNLTLYANWKRSAIWEGDIVEEIGLSNGWFALFKFTLPSGKTWADVANLKVDYKIADTSTQVAARVFGNYVDEEINTARLGTYEGNNVAVLGSWSQGSTGRWIMDNTWPGATPANSIFGTAASPEDDAWFTVEYAKPGSAPHGQWNGGVYTGGNNANPENNVEGRVPADTATGPFYLALGLSQRSATDPAVVSQVKDVKLTGTGFEAAGAPLYYQKDNVLYRAYAGQLDKNEAGNYVNFNGGQPSWKIISGKAKITPVAYVAPANITITYDLNYPNNDTEPVIAPVTLSPGETLKADQLTKPDSPTTAPTTPDVAWGFKGWYSADEDGFKIVAGNNSTGGSIFNVSTTLYAQWEEIQPVEVTYDVGNGSGTAPAAAVVAKGGSMTAEQLKKDDGLTGSGAKTVFGGFYTVDTSDGGFDYTDYSKLVTTSTKFDDDATIYAYWYEPYDGYDDFEGTEDGISTKDNNARIDEDGYIIFTTSAINYWLGNGEGDTLVTFKWPDEIAAAIADMDKDDTDETRNLKITYALKDIILPGLPEGNASAAYDAALAWKLYDSYSGTAGGNYVSWNRAASESSPVVISKLLRQSNLVNEQSGADGKEGMSIQINGNTDGNNIRTGYVYGIKIIKIEYDPAPTPDPTPDPDPDED